MIRPTLAALAGASALLLAWAGPAGAATFFVQESHPQALDTNQCTDQNAPCRTIQGAVDKAEVAIGNTVHVVAPGDHHAPVDEYDSVTLDGAFPVTLTAPGVAIRATGGATGLTVSNASIINDVAVASATGPAVSSTSSGATFTGLQTQSTGAVGFVGTGKLARSNLIGFTAGLQLTSGSPQVLNTIVRSGPSPPPGAPGIALSTSLTATLRHVTVIGFPTRAQVGASATLTAANSTFAGSNVTTDLALEAATSSANLTNTNVSPTRTAFTGGAQETQVTKTNPLDVSPGLDSLGRLTPGSALIDRGTAGGPLAGDPADAKDVDGQTRNQGSAPDVGADETAPPPPTPPTTPPTTPPAVVNPTGSVAGAAPAAAAPIVSQPIVNVPPAAKPKKKSKCRTRTVKGKKKKVCPKKKKRKSRKKK